MTSSPSDQRAPYRTHQNYLSAWRRAMESHVRATHSGPGLAVASRPAVLAAIRDTVTAHRSWTSVSPNRAFNATLVAACLKNAWTAEAMLNLTGRVVPPEGLATAANWTTIQAYYSVYHATKGLGAANSNDNHFESHPQVQGFFANYWTDGPRAELRPWSLTFGAVGAANAPFSPLPEAHSWSNVDDRSCWSIAANSLRTTRDDAVKEALRRKSRLKAAEKNKLIPVGSRRKRTRRANLTPGEKVAAEQGVRGFCLIDYLYRLRIRSNYEDVMMWVSGSSAEYEPTQIQRSLELITSGTLLATELFVYQKTGREWFIAQARDWLASAGTFQVDHEGLRGRLGLFEALPSN